MTLITLIGVYAIAFGHITLTQSMKLKGNQARVFGALCLVMAAYGLSHIHGFIDPHTAKLVGNNDVFKSAYNELVGAFGAYLAMWIQTKVLPGLRIPKVSLSYKRSR